MNIDHIIKASVEAFKKTPEFRHLSKKCSKHKYAKGNKKRYEEAGPKAFLTSQGSSEARHPKYGSTSQHTYKRPESRHSRFGGSSTGIRTVAAHPNPKASEQERQQFHLDMAKHHQELSEAYGRGDVKPEEGDYDVQGVENKSGLSHTHPAAQEYHEEQFLNSHMGRKPAELDVDYEDVNAGEGPSGFAGTDSGSAQRTQNWLEKDTDRNVKQAAKSNERSPKEVSDVIEGNKRKRS